MTLLGKIFTLCIFIASLFLMFVSMLVYSTHRNWRTDFEAVNAKLQTAQSTNLQLESKYTNQIAELNAEHEAAEQTVRQLESELQTVLAQNQRTQAEVDQLRGERREAIGAVSATEENNKILTEQVVGLRESIRESQTARDQAFNTTLQATSELHVAAGELQTLRERSAQLLQQLAEATSKLLESGVDPNADVVVQAQGEIVASRRANGGQLIEITIGYDDGVRQGQTVEIYRGDRYLGRAVIERSDPDRAVGRVLRDTQQGQIQEGDSVATKLRVG